MLSVIMLCWYTHASMSSYGYRPFPTQYMIPASFYSIYSTELPDSAIRRQLSSPNDSWRGRTQPCNIRGIWWKITIKRCSWVKHFAESLCTHFVLVLGAVSWNKRLTYIFTKLTDELTRRQQMSEDAALQHKRYLLIAWDTCIWQCYY